jgi:hypothetical protein
LAAKEGKIPLACAAIELVATKQDPKEYGGGVVHRQNRDLPQGEINRYVDLRL